MAYLDDQPLFVQAARDLGINGIVRRCHAETMAALAALGITDEARDGCGRRRGN